MFILHVKHYFFQEILKVNSLQKNMQSQCDQTFSAVITKRCAEILPNWIFFYQTRANSTF